MSIFKLSWGIALALALAPLAQAEDAPAKPAAEQAADKPAEKPGLETPAEPAPVAGEGEIAELIKQLDANSFVKRQAASVKLAAVGKAAIPALQEASLHGAREVTTRAIAVLKQHYQGAEGDLKQAAKESLEKIAATESAPAAAERAKEALAPKPDLNQAFPGGFPGGGIQIFPGNAQIQIRVQAIGGPNGKRVQIKNVNGAKEIEAEENGRKVKIAEDANGGIKMEITKQKDGKDVTEKFEAKNADELKKNHPDAHKIYEEYSKGGAQIQIQAVPFGIPALPGVPGQPIPLPAPAVRPLRIRPIDPETQKKLEEAQKQLREAVEKLQKAAAANDQEAVKQANEELKVAQNALKEAIQSRIRPAIPEALPAETPPAEKKAE